MFKWILLSLIPVLSFALEIYIDSAKDNFQKYSTLYINNNEKFICQAIKNDFEETQEVICAFNKKPFSNIRNIQNDFFKVNSFINKGTFYIKIIPIHKAKLIPEYFDLTVDNNIYKADVTLSKRWVLIGYDGKIPLLEKKKRVKDSINFPFYLDKDVLPYVGSLDIKGNPVHIKKVGDVTNYLRVKKYYKEKKFERCMEIIDEIFQEYPNTLFKAELIYYKIKLYARLKDYDNVISNAKIYLQEYSGNENIPEVLSYIAQAYSKIGIYSDADYFFDRLFSEHQDSVYTQWGYIYKGEMLENGGGIKPALKFYKKALYSTKDLEVAAAAAFDIAKTLIDTSASKSAKYVDKIIGAKPSYFREKYKESKILMNSFVDYGDMLSAAKIAKALLDTMNATHDDYEKLLSQRALWLAETEDKKDALIWLNRYLKEFPDGDYITPVQIAKDAMFFDTEDENATARLAEYNLLIEEYPNDTIGNRAIYERAKLLLSEKRYSDVLATQDALLALDEDIFSDTQEIIKEAAIGVMTTALENKECSNVLTISKDYNITLSDKWDDGIYECAMKGGDFSLSKSICQKNFKSKDLEFRKKWLYRYIKVDFATGNYSDVVDASRDLITLISDEKNSKYLDVYRYLFDTYNRLEKQELMIDAMADIEEKFGLDYKDLDRYVAMMSIGNDLKDDNMIIKYGKKVLKIQRESHSWAQSPYVEFTMFQSYINLEDYAEALAVIEILDSADLKNSDRARAKYLKGTVLNKLWRDPEASVAYREAIEADANSAWAKLAKSALEI